MFTSYCAHCGAQLQDVLAPNRLCASCQSDDDQTAACDALAAPLVDDRELCEPSLFEV